MAMQAVMEFPRVDLKRSIMVGDSETDIIFGQNAGMKAILITPTPTPTPDPDPDPDPTLSLNPNPTPTPDLSFASLIGFARELKNSLNKI
jgi:FMN phosphatase YigB (HAD superfamily)